MHLKGCHIPLQETSIQSFVKTDTLYLNKIFSLLLNYNAVVIRKYHLIVIKLNILLITIFRHRIKGSEPLNIRFYYMGWATNSHTRIWEGFDNH